MGSMSRSKMADDDEWLVEAHEREGKKHGGSMKRLTRTLGMRESMRASVSPGDAFGGAGSCGSRVCARAMGW